MNKIKIFFSVSLIFILTFLLSFFALQFAKQKGREDLFRATNPYDLVIKNARIIDGTGREPFDAHIGIRNGQIITVSKNLRLGNADLFDATGFTLLPQMVAIPAETDWVSRDLPGAMSRFPYYRIFFKTSDDPLLAGRSLEAVLKDGVYREEELSSYFTWTVLIAPEGNPIQSDNLISAIYKLTGWRADALGLSVGKIQANYMMEARLYRTKNINPATFLELLQREVMPPAEFTVRGNALFDERRGVEITVENWPPAEEEAPTVQEPEEAEETTQDTTAAGTNS